MTKSRIQPASYSPSPSISHAPSNSSTDASTWNSPVIVSTLSPPLTQVGFSTDLFFRDGFLAEEAECMVGEDAGTEVRHLDVDPQQCHLLAL